MRIATFKAQRLTDRSEPTPDLVIVAQDEFPECLGKSLDEVRELHMAKGRELAEGLINHLPGGTLDAVLRVLLEHRASLLVVKANA